MSDNTTSTDTLARTSIDAATLLDTFPRMGLTAESNYIETIDQPAKPADTVPIGDVLRPELAESYTYDPFSHQADALDAFEAGQNVTVATSTSSRKTHIYGLQIARNLLDAGVLPIVYLREESMVLLLLSGTVYTALVWTAVMPFV